MGFARVDTRPRRQNAGRPDWKIARAFLQFLRGRPCACKGANDDCGGDIQAAHIPVPGEKGTGTKVADRHAIPLSENCHRLQHNLGWRTFASRFLAGREPIALADSYWFLWPGRAAWERKNTEGAR
jgi:hypothetical protein